MERALAGAVITRSDFRLPALATADVRGRTFLDVRTVGKHLFFRFGADAGGAGDVLSLHSHLRMDGEWRVVRRGARWSAPGHQVRVALATGAAEVIGVRVHDVALLPVADEHRWVGHLGPDLLDAEWSDEHAGRAAENLAADPARELGVALLDQRALAGVGNLYKVETCFLLGVTPWTPVSDVDPVAAVTLARKLLRANAHRWQQSTTGELAPRRRTWVYERTRHGCFRCGGPVRVAPQGSGVEQRPTWFCPRCQQGPTPGR